MKKRSGSKAQQKRAATAAAKKQRRQKVMAFGGLGVLAILMFIQVPKLLGGSDSPESVAVAATPVIPAPETGKDARALRLLLKNAGADPFASRSLADNDPRAGSVSGPGGTHDPFVESGSSTPAAPATPSTEDPVAAPLPGKIVLGTPKAGAVARRGWIVVLASVQNRFGRAYAERFATRVRQNGLGTVSVLDSSTRKPLRAGYFVVYTGPFESLAAVQRSAAHVHAFGYRTAYVREILRY